MFFFCQGLREQLADTGAGFVYAALDVRDYPCEESTQDGLLALRKLSLVLVQVAKWASKAVAALQPARTVAADPDASRIMKRLAALRQSEVLLISMDYTPSLIIQLSP